MATVAGRKWWRSGPPSGSPGADVLAQLYGAGKSYAEIGTEFGVTATTVMRWMRKAGIQARTPSEATRLGSPKRVITDEYREKLRANAALARAAITAESRKKHAEKMRGRSPANKGRPWTPEQRAKLRASRDNPEYREKHAAAKRGALGPNWRGGVSGDADSLSSWEWRQARLACYERDRWKCRDCGVKCGSRGPNRIQAHHVIRRRDGGGDELENLLTLCASCHHKREHRFKNALFA